MFGMFTRKLQIFNNCQNRAVRYTYQQQDPVTKRSATIAEPELLAGAFTRVYARAHVSCPGMQRYTSKTEVTGRWRGESKKSKAEAEADALKEAGKVLCKAACTRCILASMSPAEVTVYLAAEQERTELAGFADEAKEEITAHVRQTLPPPLDS
jgi:hypothetical protein